MRVLSKLSFQAKIGLGIFLIVVAVALMTAIPVSRMASRAILAEAKNRGLVLAENLSLRLADAMLTMDLLRMKTMVDELTVVGQDILYAFVQDENGNVLVHTFQKGFPVALARANAAQGDGANITLLDTGQELVYDFAAPVAISGRRFGTARLGLSRSRAEAQVRSLLVTFAGLSAAALAAAILLSTMFARRVTRRLNVLKQYAQEVVRGNLDIETASTLERNCWEIMDCKRQECPAYGKPRHRCWHMQGTLCPDCAPADNNGRKACHRCPVYRENAGDEIQDLAETFGIMAMTLKRQISALARQEQLMRTILDATPDLVCLLDPHGRVLAVNRAFAAFLEKPESEIVGRLEHELFPPEEATVRRERNLAVLASERGGQALVPPGGRARARRLRPGLGHPQDRPRRHRGQEHRGKAAAGPEDGVPGQAGRGRGPRDQHPPGHHPGLCPAIAGRCAPGGPAEPGPQDHRAPGQGLPQDRGRLARFFAPARVQHGRGGPQRLRAGGELPGAPHLQPGEGRP
jgi:PAS domain-containing protein